MVKHFLQWGWPDAEIEELIETAYGIEGRRMGEAFERALGGRKNIENS
jgi:hypothetical protein